MQQRTNARMHAITSAIMQACIHNATLLQKAYCHCFAHLFLERRPLSDAHCYCLHVQASAAAWRTFPFPAHASIRRVQASPACNPECELRLAPHLQLHSRAPSPAPPQAAPRRLSPDTPPPRLEDSLSESHPSAAHSCVAASPNAPKPANLPLITRAPVPPLPPGNRMPAGGGNPLVARRRVSSHTPHRYKRGGRKESSDEPRTAFLPHLPPKPRQAEGILTSISFRTLVGDARVSAIYTHLMLTAPGNLLMLGAFYAIYSVKVRAKQSARVIRSVRGLVEDGSVRVPGGGEE
eukprot:279297-Chlamydomonas_euryale.AAC.4